MSDFESSIRDHQRMVNETHRILRIWSKYLNLIRALYSIGIIIEDRMSYNDIAAYDARLKSKQQTP